MQHTLVVVIQEGKGRRWCVLSEGDFHELLLRHLFHPLVKLKNVRKVVWDSTAGVSS